jgi:chromosome segregation ATPase
MKTMETQKIEPEFMKLDAALESGKNLIEELKGEMDEWKDNMDNANMSHLPKYDEVDECASSLDSVLDTLENVEMSWPEPEHAQIQVPTLVIRKRMTRAQRMSNAVAYLEAVKSELEGLVETIQAGIDDLDLAINEAGDVSFPGAFN